MPKTLQGFIMTAAVVILVIAIATRIQPIAKLAGLPPAA